MWKLMQDRRMALLLTANILSSIGSGITMIGIPWLFVTRDGGDALFGYVTLMTTLLLFFFSPYMGALIDRHSRKRLLLISEVVGGGVVLAFALWGLFTGSLATWQLVVIYFGGSLYYSMHYPTQFAFTQEIFAREQYKALNSVLEVQNQTASMIAGGLAGLLIEWVDVSWILLADALTYGAGFVLFTMIPYERSAQVAQNQQVSMWANVGEGFRYLKQQPVLTVFFLCALMPFLVVMVGNYLYPVYVADVLQAAAGIFGASNMLYAIGAILAGLTIPLLIQRVGPYGTILCTFIGYTLSVLLIFLVPVVGVFLALKLLNGWGNAGTRVARNTIMMETVPNQMMGRVNSFFNAAGMGMRVLLLGLTTQVVALSGANTAVLILAALLVFTFSGILWGRQLFIPKQAPEQEKRYAG